MRKQVYFENLDGLRFFCFLSVFLFHGFHTEYENLKDHWLYGFVKWQIFGNGNLGVNFFFVLSGFLITFLLIEERKLTGRIHIGMFWVRRILRIWPLFFFCVFFGFFIFPLLKSLLGGTPNESASIIYYLTFLNNFDFIRNGSDASVLSVLWSVAVEEQFYLVWPLLLFAFPVRLYWLPILSIIVMSTIFRVNNGHILNEYHSLSCIGDLAVGAFGAWIVSVSSRFSSFVVLLPQHIQYLPYCVFFFFFFFRGDFLTSSSIALAIERLIISLSILGIILSQSFCSRNPFPLSRLKRVTQLGKISYGLYCLHFVGILIVTTLTRKIGMNVYLWQVMVLETTLALVVTIVLSYLSYNFYERPFLLLKDRFAFIVR